MKWVDVLLRVLLYGSFACTAFGQIEGQSMGKSIFQTQYSCTAKNNESPIRTEDLTVLGFTIGASTIRDVQNRFPETRPVKLAFEVEAEQGICLKNRAGMAAVFATGVMGAEDTLTAIYLAPARMVEKAGITCRSVRLKSNQFVSGSGLSVGATSDHITKLLHARVGSRGPFCIAYTAPSAEGPLEISKHDKADGHDFTGAEGHMRSNKLEWVKLFGIASD